MDQLVYLESLDSVRSIPVGAATSGAADLQQLQVFSEVLMVLALGRSVVVPQSYAFDSLAFLRVAHTVLGARPRRERPDRPFRLHLYNAHSFDAAISAMLRRVHHPERPFVSSLLPELSDLAPEEV